MIAVGRLPLVSDPHFYCPVMAQNLELSICDVRLTKPTKHLRVGRLLRKELEPAKVSDRMRIIFGEFVIEAKLHNDCYESDS